MVWIKIKPTIGYSPNAEPPVSSSVTFSMHLFCLFDISVPGLFCDIMFPMMKFIIPLSSNDKFAQDKQPKSTFQLSTQLPVKNINTRRFCKLTFSTYPLSTISAQGLVKFGERDCGYSKEQIQCGQQ